MDQPHTKGAFPVRSFDRHKPVPHADELHRILAKHRIAEFNAKEPGSLIDFILHGNVNPNPNSDLDINILDPAGVKKIVEKAWQKYKNTSVVQGSLLWDMFPTETEEQRKKIDKLKVDYRRAARWKGDNYFGYLQLDVVANMALRQMKQSLYFTKERIEWTSALRKKYYQTPSYKIALYTATVNLNIIRMESMWLTMETWLRDFNDYKKDGKEKNVHFLWYLIFYEKVLASNVDVTDTVRRILELHNDFVEEMPVKK